MKFIIKKKVVNLVDSTNIEATLISGIFYGFVDFRNIKISAEMFSNKEYSSYVKFIYQNYQDEIKAINSKFSVVSGINLSLFDYAYTDTFFKSYNTINVLELFYKQAVERLAREKMSLAGKSEGASLREMGVVMNEIQDLLRSITMANEEKESLVDSYRKSLFEARKAASESEREGLAGLSTGFAMLDSITRGFKNEYVIIAGRPSMGKTALALDSLVDSVINGKNVLFFSLEMPKEQIMARLISKLDKSLSLSETLYGDNYEQTKDRIEDVLLLIENSNLEIEDFSNHNGKITILEIENRYKKYIQEHGSLDLAMVDYIQLIASTDKRMDENTALTQISSDFKRFVKTTKATWVVLSQLSRNLEQRADKRPMNSDLRGSGSLEQDADMIIFPYREAVYLIKELEESLKKKPDSQLLADKLNALKNAETELAEIIISKHRNGPVGTVIVDFLKKNASYIGQGEISLPDFDDL